MKERRRALILENHSYEDPEMQAKLLPGWDVDFQPKAVMDLKRVLEDPNIGGFEAMLLIDRPSYEVQQAVETFFAESQPDDIILLIFSGQGIKGRDGMLYFLTIDTKLDLLRSSAVSARFINEIMGLSPSEQKIMILDCSYIGPFTKQEVTKGERDVVAGEYFAGSGRVVLSASQNMRRSTSEGAAFANSKEGQGIIRNLAYGLQSGKADIDKDGQVSAEDLYEYLSESQKPEIWRDPATHGDPILAKTLKPAADETNRQSIKPKDWKEDAIEHLKRYPRLDCPDKVQLNKRFSLSIQLLRDEPTPGAYGIIILDSGVPEKPPELTVLLSAYGFDIEGSDRTLMVVDQTRNSEAHFVLMPKSLGEHQIRADFYQFGSYIGTVRRNVMVTEVPEDVTVKQLYPPVELELKYAPVASPPDLVLTIELDPQGDQNNMLHFRLHSNREDVGYNFARLGEVTLQGSPQDKMASLCKEMSQMARQSGTDAKRKMESIGMSLWDELIPEELKKEYWDFGSKVESLYIISEEPWIPWEIVKPYRFKEDNEREDAPFWCQHFNLSRWLSGKCPIDELPNGVARPVAPAVIELNKVKEEVTFIEQLNSLNPGIRGQTSISSRTQLLDLMERDSFSILHFATHGGFDPQNPNNSPLVLSDGLLEPRDIRVRFGGRRPRPLVFINACKGAQMGFSYTRLGGWAMQLINQTNVGAFAGAMWEVDDALALEFAKCFYTSLLRERQTFAQAFRLAREKVRASDPSNSTWLAYVLYANPEGRVKDKA